MIDAICQRYHCLPSELLREDVSLIHRLNVVLLAEPKEAGDGK